MFVAMMVPLSGTPVAHVRDRSLARRRWRAVALFMAGYALPWIAATVLLLLAAQWILAAKSPALWALALAGIAVCQSSPWKQRTLNRCHAHPTLPAFGARADLGVLRFGVSHAVWCMGSCVALMLLPMLFTRGHLAVMAGVTLWLAGERFEKPMPPRWRWRGPGKAVRIAIGQSRVWGKRFGQGIPVPCAVAIRASPSRGRSPALGGSGPA
jgi:predicted metal-binding membrane protein